MICMVNITLKVKSVPQTASAGEGAASAVSPLSRCAAKIYQESAHPPSQRNYSYMDAQLQAVDSYGCGSDVQVQLLVNGSALVTCLLVYDVSGYTQHSITINRKYCAATSRHAPVNL